MQIAHPAEVSFIQLLVIHMVTQGENGRMLLLLFAKGEVK